MVVWGAYLNKFAQVPKGGAPWEERVHDELGRGSLAVLTGQYGWWTHGAVCNGVWTAGLA